MLLFHYVLCFVRRATILLYMRVLLSTRAVNEQLEENERERKKEKNERKKEKKKRKSFFFTCQHHYQGWFALYFLEQERKKNAREKEK
jgi:hypothetical protein